MGQRVGVLAAILAVALAITSIASHRTHTAAIIAKAAANDAWSHYQSTRLKYHNLELGEDLAAVIGAKGEAAAKTLVTIASQKSEYERKGKANQAEAEKADAAAEGAEHRGLRYDIGEGLLEIALVLSSLDFISRKRMFPVIGVLAGVAGSLVALTGLML